MEHARNQEWQDEWDAISRTADDLRNKRNDAVHSVWGVVPGSEHRMWRVRAKSKVSVRNNVVPTEQLNALSESIIDLINRLIDFDQLLHNSGGWGIATIAPKVPPLVPGQGREARAQAQARAQKKAQKEADRAAFRKLPSIPNDS